MKKNPLIRVSIAVACVIVLASSTSVVGVQPVESLNYTFNNDEILLGWEVI